MSPAIRPEGQSGAFGRFRLHAVPAVDVWHARGTLPLDAIGPRVSVSVALEAGGLRPGEVAGLALFERPYAWLGVERLRRGFALAQFDERTGQATRISLGGPSVFLRAECDLTRQVANFLYSVDRTRYSAIGVRYALTSRDVAPGSIRCAVFCVGPAAGPSGGYADFAEFVAVNPTPQVPSNRAERAPGPRRIRARAGRSRDS